MNSTASEDTPQRRARGAISRELGLDIKPIESSVPFFLYMVFLAFFYLRFAARVPLVAPFRPELIMAIIITLSIIPYLSSRADLFRLPAARALSLLILWILLTLPFVQWPGSVLRENWFPFVKAVLLFYFTILVVDTPNRLRWAVFLFLGFQVFRILEPLYLNITQGYMGSRTHIHYGEFADRLSGAPADVINPNGLGFVIASSVVFIHFLLWQSTSKALKLVYLMLMPAMLYALILTMSRGGFLALLVGGIIIFWQSRHKAALMIAAIATVILAWSVMTDVQQERYVSLVSPDTEQSAGVEGRLTGMKNEFLLGLNRPLFGYGLGTTSEAKVNVLGGKREASHSLYAELLIETGIGGFALFMLFLWRVYSLVRNNLKRLGHASELNQAFGFYGRFNGGLFVVFWVYAVYSVNYYGLSQDYWYLFAGLCTAFGLIIERSDQTLRKSDQWPTDAERVRA